MSASTFWVYILYGWAGQREEVEGRRGVGAVVEVETLNVLATAVFWGYIVYG